MVQTLFTHPRILSVGAPTATGMVVEDGTITAVGEYRELRQEFSPKREVALPGHAVVAGFHDAHIHSGSVARDLASIDLRAAASLEDALEMIRSHLAAQPGEHWVTGGYWDANVWASGVPTRHDLDSVCADRPVALASLDGHSVWVNSLGLRLAEISETTPDPEGGLILRESDGRTPAGVLRESACDRVRELSERDLDPQLEDLLAAAQQRFLSMGLTHLTDFDEEATRLAFAAMHSAGTLKLRVHKGIPMSELDRAVAEGWRTGAGDRMMTTGPVKLFSDGAMGSHSAHMGHDFADDPGNHGVEVIPTDELARLVELANAHGIAVATHAIGDEANHSVLNAYARHAGLTGERGLRNRIEHSQHVRREDLQRFVDLGVVASLQPTHCTTDFRLASRRIGDRDLANYAWRSLLDLGAHVAFGSDAPIEPANPLYGVHAAATRQNRSGEPAGGFEPHERVSVVEALDLYSAGAAYAANIDDRVGRLAAGQYADFVVLDADPTEIDPEQIWQINVDATIVDGDVVFERGA